MNTNAPTVFIVDDDPSDLKALSRILRMNGMNPVMFSSAQEFLDWYSPHSRGCLVLDVTMPGLDGLQLQQELIDRGGEIPIIFLTGFGDIPTSVRAMKAGAVDFLTKPVMEKDLCRAIRVASERDLIRRKARSELDDIRRRLNALTPRQREVLKHVVTGRLNKQIAADLGTVEQTVKIHRRRIMEKMQVQSVAELARLAERAGL